MIDALRGIVDGLSTIVVLAFVLGTTAVLSYGFQAVLRNIGLGVLTTGWTGALIVVVGFVIAFAIAFGGLTLWYANSSESAHA